MAVYLGGTRSVEDVVNQGGGDRMDGIAPDRVLEPGGTRKMGYLVRGKDTEGLERGGAFGLRDAGVLERGPRAWGWARSSSRGCTEVCSPTPYI